MIFANVIEEFFAIFTGVITNLAKPMNFKLMPFESFWTLSREAALFAIIERQHVWTSFVFQLIKKSSNDSWSCLETSNLLFYDFVNNGNPLAGLAIFKSKKQNSVISFLIRRHRRRLFQEDKMLFLTVIISNWSGRHVCSYYAGLLLCTNYLLWIWILRSYIDEGARTTRIKKMDEFTQFSWYFQISVQIFKSIFWSFVYLRTLPPLISVSDEFSVSICLSKLLTERATCSACLARYFMKKLSSWLCRKSKSKQILIKTENFRIFYISQFSLI